MYLAGQNTSKAALCSNGSRNQSKHTPERRSKRSVMLVRCSNSWAILGRGLQDWQHTYLGLSDQTLNDLDRARRSLLRCGSVLEVAEFQRATSVELMQRTVASNVALLQIAVQVGRDAAGPLRAREEARRHP